MMTEQGLPMDSRKRYAFCKNLTVGKFRGILAVHLRAEPMPRQWCGFPGHQCDLEQSEVADEKTAGRLCPGMQYQRWGIAHCRSLHSSGKRCQYVDNDHQFD